jgi:hypothetical protein
MMDKRHPATTSTFHESSGERCEPTQLPEQDLQQEVTLLELLDRVLDKGVVLSGDITLSVADVDLVYVGLRVLLSSVEAARSHAPGNPAAQAVHRPTPASS